MNTLASGKEVKTFAKSKQILLTLKKTAGNCHMTAVITPINKNRGLKIVDRKFVVIQKNGSLLSKAIKGLEKGNVEVDGIQMPRAEKSLTKSRKTLEHKEQFSMLKNPQVSESMYCQNCSKVLQDSEEGDDSDTKSLGPALNKHDRFVPNILRSNKVAENILNNNNHAEFDATYCEITYKTEEKNIKRNRKQVLRPLNNRLDCTRRNWYQNKKSQLSRTLPSIRNQNLAEKSKTETIPVNPSNLEQKDSKIFVEMEAEGSATAEDAATDDLYTANLNIPCENVNQPSPEKTEMNYTDKSIKKVFDEFEVADYQNYIASEDLNFDIDEMDKLLCSDIHDSLTGYDVNDNHVDSRSHALKKKKNKNKKKLGDITSRTEHYDHETEPSKETRRIQSYENQDAICFEAFGDCKIYQTSKIGLGSHTPQDYFASNDFEDLNHRLKRDVSSSTESASECEDDLTTFSQSLSLLLPRDENWDLFSSSLAVSDVVPNNVLSNEFTSDGLASRDTVKLQVDSSPMMQKDDMNSNASGNDDFNSSEPLKGLTSNLQLFNGLDGTLGLSEDGHFLLGDIQDINCTASSTDESCKRILADSNIKFDNNHFSNMQNILSDLDIENADDIEISKLLRQGNSFVKEFQPITDPPLQPAVINPPSRLSSTELDHSSKEKAEKKIEAGYNPQSEFYNALEIENFLFDNVGDIREIGLNDNRDFEWQDSASVKVSSDRDELALSCDPETNDIDSTKSGGRCSTPPLTEGRNMEKPKISKLESLLTRPKTVVDNRSRISRIHSKFNSNEVNIPNSVITLSDKSSPCRTTEYQNTEDTSQSHVVEEENVNGQDRVTDLDDDDSCSRTKSMNRQLLELNSSRDRRRRSNKCQLYPSPVSLTNTVSSGSLPDNSRKPKRDVRKNLVKRKKRAAQIKNFLFPCSSCDQKCRSDAALANHIQTHHCRRSSQFGASIKKYVCDKCSKEYSLAGAIEKHFKLHENYSLTCRICEKHFSEKTYLKRHVFSSHLHWQYECSYCSRKFAIKNVLTRHLKECHGIQFC